jgi:hypothetical protein
MPYNLSNVKVTEALWHSTKEFGTVSHGIVVMKRYRIGEVSHIIFTNISFCNLRFQFRLGFGSIIVR